MTATIESHLAAITERFGINNPALLERWANASSLQQFNKGQHSIHAGDQTTFFGFITRGIFRYYYTNPEGKEWNKCFFSEGQAIGSMSSLITGHPCPFSIQALEDAEIISTPIALLPKLQQDYAEFKEMLYQIAQFILIRNEQREAMLLTRNAEQRYQWLLESEPELAQRVPQFHLASYLGMDAVSLSRIKKKSQ